MPHNGVKRSQTCRTATARTPEGELKRHLADLGLDNAEEYRNWCRVQGFSANLNKTWQERRAEAQAAQKQAARDAERGELTRHWQALGFGEESAYLEWSRAHGFGGSERKSAKQKRMEKEKRELETAQIALSHSRQQARRPENAITRLYHDPREAVRVKTPYLQKIGALFAGEANNDVRNALLQLLLRVQAGGRLFGLEPVIADLGHNPGNTFLDGLHALARRHADWQNSPEDWQPDTRNAPRQFGALARHLLTRYAVPGFMDRVWFEGDGERAARHQDWFLHIGRGQNIRTADLPFALTKMAAHWFLLAPDDFSIEAALRWGQIRALGGGESLVRAVIATRLGHDLETLPDPEFWQSVIHFFVNNPMLDMDWIGPMVDFIYDRKFVPREVIGADEQLTILEPAEPTFSMKGRTAAALQLRVEAWHRQLAKDTRKSFRQWEPSGIGTYAGAAPDPNTGKAVRWQIVELLDSAALKAEGKTMHHCVASYDRSCARGQTSIWSMRIAGTTEETYRNVMTIAVNNASRTITQAKGRCNKGPGDKRAGDRLNYAPLLLKQWATQEKLTVPSYV